MTSPDPAPAAFVFDLSGEREASDVLYCAVAESDGPALIRACSDAGFSPLAFGNPGTGCPIEVYLLVKTPMPDEKAQAVWQRLAQDAGVRVIQCAALSEEEREIHYLVRSEGITDKKMLVALQRAFRVTLWDPKEMR